MAIFSAEMGAAQLAYHLNLMASVFVDDTIMDGIRTIHYEGDNIQTIILIQQYLQKAYTMNREHMPELPNMQEIGTFFNSVYANAQGNAQTIPWARLAPRPLFKQWADSTGLQGTGKKALQVACGLGDDAEELARLGFQVTAFDISPVAIEWCKQRFPDSRVQYQVADLFALPESWQHSFDFILESYTIQAMPRPMRPQAMSNIARTLAPGGILLIICRGTDDINENSMPLPVMREELAVFQQEGLQEVSFEDFPASDTLSARHFRVVYRA